MKTKAKCTELAESVFVLCPLLDACELEPALATGNSKRAKEFMCGRFVRERVHVKLKQAEMKTKKCGSPKIRTDPGPSNIHGRI